MPSVLLALALKVSLLKYVCPAHWYVSLMKVDVGVCIAAPNLSPVTGTNIRPNLPYKPLPLIFMVCWKRKSLNLAVTLPFGVSN